MLFDRRQRFGGGAHGFNFHLAIEPDKFCAERRQLSGPPASPAVLPLDQWLGKYRVEVVDQIPGSLVRHLHRLGGLGYRAVLANELQELDAAVADIALSIEDDAELDHRHWNIAFALGHSNGYGVFVCHGLRNVDNCGSRKFGFL